VEVYLAECMEFVVISLYPLNLAIYEPNKG